ncbi:hypothetical protein C1E23_01110 [Pseudoalteromonas phenolica]|uniref:Uncharacterized protein n=1 Tax=Pseudoalteromonas phenolica TaxID=161398 RepID=A0A4Q7IRD1_9GAMM|nr:hypothetical protein [Pseudoalteromonas phenolica]RZQ54914.1 hypothetical protein C1E23_01110 [Pseudoalteromonas phenolica]
MELKDFIKQAVLDISDAVREINSESDDVIVNPASVANSQSIEMYGKISTISNLAKEDPDYLRPVHTINFDIAVTTSKKEDGKEGIGVNLTVVKLDKGNNNTSSSDVSNKLTFSLPVALPVGRASSLSPRKIRRA